MNIPRQNPTTITLVLTFLLGTAGAHSDPITFGATIPLTGDFATYGTQIQQGIEVAREKLAAQGIETKVLYEDACFPREALPSLKKLIHMDGIDALVANFCLIAMPPMAPQLEAFRVLSFHTASASDSILNSSPYVFATNVRVRDEARALAEHAFEKLHARSASVLYITTDFGADYNRYFSERFESLGGKILTSDTEAAGTMDFRSELARVKAKRPDVIFAAHLGASLGVLLSQARVIGLKQQFLSVYEAEDPSVPAHANGAAEGLLFFTPSDSDSKDSFRQAFETRFNRSPGILARNAYDATLIAGIALFECARDARCARDRVSRLSGFAGASDTISIEADGGVTRKLTLKTVKDGLFVSAERHGEDA